MNMRNIQDEEMIEGYISLDGDQVTAAIFSSLLSDSKGDYYVGAYYGYAGGGVNDGGFFSIDIENSFHKHIDFDEFDEIRSQNIKQHSVLEALMQRIWHYIEEEDDILQLTSSGLKLKKNENGVWISDNFDGDFL
ncbi:hypothetical protein N9S44_03090, partial [Gammaproteobacteria bacterium]|nr:hypothetical protein [Gammaproteobacteria bacterium]